MPSSTMTTSAMNSTTNSTDFLPQEAHPSIPSSPSLFDYLTPTPFNFYLLLELILLDLSWACPMRHEWHRIEPPEHLHKVCPKKLVLSPQTGRMASTSGKTTQEENEILRNAYNYLGENIGYKDYVVDTQRLGIVFGDTITTLEKLKFGAPISHRPREWAIPDLLKKIGSLVPKDTLNMEEIENVKKVKGLAYARAAKLIALGDYIKKLREQKQDTTELEGERRQDAGVRSEAERQLSIEETLHQIDKWCDAWLRKDLKDDDWHTLSDCLHMDNL